MSSRGESTEQPSKPPPTIGTEHGYLLIAALSAAIGGLLGTLDRTTDEDFPLEVYILLATALLIGGCGWLVRSEGAQRRHEAAELRELLAELTSRPRTHARVCPTPQRAAGGLYGSGGQGETVGIRNGTVDPATDPTADPTGSALERAHEDGIEQGFDLGLKVQLAEREVTPLSRARRRRRLTGDS